jgi:hypothetical protein
MSATRPASRLYRGRSLGHCRGPPVLHANAELRVQQPRWRADRYKWQKLTSGEDSAYEGADDKNWMTLRSGSGDVAILPMNGWESSKMRNRFAATRTPKIATTA